MERLTAGSLAPTHDLIRLREPIALAVDAPVPPWVEPVLRRAPWVVVRRGHVRDGMMPVGVRGLSAIAAVCRLCGGRRDCRPAFA